MTGDEFRNRPDLPMPSYAFPNRHDGSVYLVTVDEKGVRHRKTIGALTVDTPGKERMRPNSYFEAVYREDREEKDNENRMPGREMRMGLYALTLCIGSEKHLFRILESIYGTAVSDRFMDYAMFSVISQGDPSLEYETAMDSQVLFSAELCTDAWYEEFFSERMLEDGPQRLRIKWIEYLLEKGLKKVWLSADGSDGDAEGRNRFLSAYGFCFSHGQEEDAAGVLYALDAKTGRPVSCMLYDGSIPSCHDFQEMADFLNRFGIETEGLILGPGFAVDDVFKTAGEKNWKYIISLPGESFGHLEMVSDFAETIRWNARMMQEEDLLFATQARKRLFRSKDRFSEICLYFDGLAAGSQSIRVSEKILSAKEKIQAAIERGERAFVPADLRSCLSLEGEGGELKVRQNFEAWNQSMAQSGFFSLAVSEGISPARASRLYKMRGGIETLLRRMKSREGDQRAAFHKTEGSVNRLVPLFLSAIIRFEMEARCKKLGLDLEAMLQGLGRIALYKGADGYAFVRPLTDEQKKLFDDFGFGRDDFALLAKDFDRRSQTVSQNPVPAKQQDELLIYKNTHRRGRPKKEEADSEAAKGGQQEMKGEKSKGGTPEGKKGFSAKKDPLR